LKRKKVSVLRLRKKPPRISTQKYASRRKPSTGYATTVYELAKPIIENLKV